MKGEVRKDAAGVKEKPQKREAGRGFGRECEAYPSRSAKMPPYRRGGADSRSASARSGGPGTRRSSEFMILRSPENITDVDPDTKDDWDRECRPQIKKIVEPAKKVTRSMGQLMMLSPWLT